MYVSAGILAFYQLQTLACCMRLFWGAVSHQRAFSPDMQYGGMIQSPEYVDALLPWAIACLEVVLNSVHAHAHECFPGEVPKESPDDVLADSLYSSVHEDKAPAKKTLPKQMSFSVLGLSMETGA